MPYTDSNGFTKRGIPFAYTKTIDTHGACVGYEDEISTSGSCGKREFPVGYLKLITDMFLMIGLSFTLAYIVTMLRHIKSQ